jgi:cytochrome c553
MSPKPSPSARNRWFTTAVGVNLLIASMSIITGFVWLPFAQPDSPFRSVWDAICSSAGLIRNRPVTDIVSQGNNKSSAVVVSADMLAKSTAESIGRGGTPALQCTMCHGARGLSNANTPNLAGQYAAAIYKQLQDYTSGARTNAIMSPRVASLSAQDMRDLAAYYSYLPRLPPYHPVNAGPAPQIVVNGAPMRNIPPCATCRGEVDHKVGSAWLEGESAAYLRTQLEAFASGNRHNDISGQMRNVARGMTPAEIERAAAYYASQYPNQR